tara:strand:+ start:709 stop:921 length:213 start_codon:yes stop_codon:yes gene_type:complete
MGAFLAKLLLELPLARQRLSAQLQVSYLVLVPMMYSLNLYWFGKIVAGVRRALAKLNGATEAERLHGKVE